MKNEGTRRHLCKLLKQRQIDARLIFEAMNITDGHGQQITARALYELTNLIRVGLKIRLGNMIVLLALDGAKLRLDGHAIAMAIVDRLAREANVLFKGKRGTVDHDRGEASLDRLAYVLERLAVIEMQTRGNDIILRRALYDGCDHAVIGQLDVSRGDLKNTRHPGPL